MTWDAYQSCPTAVTQVTRSLSNGRLAHAYLIQGERLEVLEGFATVFACTINCNSDSRKVDEPLPTSPCNRCASCLKTQQMNHPDVCWLRAASKSRQITREQVGDLMHLVSLKPNEALYKVGIIAGADRMTAQAANAFLKTLEEPPMRSILLLLTTAPSSVMETIRSRCQRIQLNGDTTFSIQGSEWDWLRAFAERAATTSAGILERYKLMSGLIENLSARKEAIEEKLEASSPLHQYEDPEPEIRKRLEAELAAAVEAEYRRERTEILGALQWWFRDVWLQTVGVEEQCHRLPELRTSTQAVAKRLKPEDALVNVEQMDATLRLLNTNVQEVLALETGLLKLKL